MHTFLIIGGTAESRATYISRQLDDRDVHVSDRIVMESNVSIGIAEVRQLQKKLNLKAMASDTKALCLLTAESLTQPAQQALLKTLEEPPEHTVLYLSAPTDEVFLPTVLSRAHIVRLSTSKRVLDSEETADCTAFWTQVLGTKPVERLSLLPDLGRERTAFLDFLDVQLHYVHGLLLAHYAMEKGSSKPLQLAKIMQEVVSTRDLIAANCNPQLALDHLFLTI